MRIEITHQDVADNPTVGNKAIAKMFSAEEWDATDLTHAEIQWAITNDKPIYNAVLYSPVLTMNNLTSIEVPASWPNSEKFDEEGESLGQKNFEEYAQYHAVDGGYCIKFSDGAADANKNIRLPKPSQVPIWENKVNGFLTQVEFEAIRVVEEP